MEGERAEEGCRRNGRGGDGSTGVGNSRVPVVLGHDAETRHLVQIAPADIPPPPHQRIFSIPFLAHFSTSEGHYRNVDPEQGEGERLVARLKRLSSCQGFVF